MDFMADYWSYNSCYEIHRNYSQWSALALLGAVVNRKVYFLHGDIEIHGNLYVLLVGPQGNGKTTPCDFATRCFQTVCPDLEIGASTQSAEDIVVQMSREDFVRCYTNELGEQVEVRPYAFFINEFKDFIAYSPTRMMNFLGNIYDRKSFKASTIKRGAEDIINPSLNILACENPDQLSKLMKNDIVTGGMSRRMIIVYETGYNEPRPFINIPPEILAALNLKNGTGRIIDRLREVRKLVGQYKWEASGKKFYEPWYIETKRSLASVPNPIMRGYLSTKHIQLFKICMLLDCVSDKPMFQFTADLMEEGLANLDVLETNMPKLSVSAGKNEMAASYQDALEVIIRHGGWIPEKQLKRELELNLDPTEIFSALRYMEETDQIVKKLVAIKNAEGTPIERWMIMTPEFWKLGVREGRFK